MAELSRESDKSNLNFSAEADAFLGSCSSALIWEYDLATRVMKYTSFDSDGNPVSTNELPNFISAIRDMHIIFEDDVPSYDVFCAEMEAGKDFLQIEYRALNKDYQLVYYRSIAQTLKDEEGKPSRVIGRRYEITREKNQREGQPTNQDTLTGLQHRENIRKLVSDLQNENPNLNAAYILIDLDNFKEVNDTFGKMKGDVILQTVSGLIYTNFMPKDLVGRIAGDQFMVFCTDIQKEKVHELIKELMKRIRENVPEVNGHSLAISVGISYAPEDGQTFEVCYSKADMALYKAKKDGGDCLVEFSEEDCKDICIGYTMATMGKFTEDEVAYDKASKKVNKQLFDFAFEIMNRESDFSVAIETIFEELCLHYGLDRAQLIEFDEGREKIHVSSGWCRLDNDTDVEIFNSIPMTAWELTKDAYEGESYLIFKDGRSKNLDFFRELVRYKYPPVSSIQFPIMDNENMQAVVFFECFEEHNFMTNEIATINSVVRLIRSYLLSRRVKNDLETESVINKNVMDAQKVIYYIIDENTHEVKYLSKYAKEKFPYAHYGDKCYECIRRRKDHCKICPMHDGMGDSNSVRYFDENDGKWYTLTASRMKGINEETDVLVCITDVTDFLTKVRSEDNLTVAASFDSFVVSATKLLSQPERQNEIICLGISHFAKINDEFGYVTGDAVLKRLAELIREDIGEEDLFCRIKGDDFAILVNQDCEDAFSEYISRYSRILTSEFRQKHPAIEINCFAGMYPVKSEDEYVNKCIDSAMKARRLALSDITKTHGFCVYSNEIEEREIEEERVAGMIKKALEDKRFRVYFQPKVDVTDGSIMGAEALVRMFDEDGKMVSPGIFIPLAEKNGSVIQIDEEVYRQTFEMMARWKKEGKRVPLISVNVSRLHLFDDELPMKIKRLSEEYEVDASNVELEITESVFFEDTQRLVRMIKNLKDFGFTISMDDFGSGYSTLNFMKELPVDVIKIDGGFFMRNQMDKKSKAVISAIMQLTKNLEFESISEGVETEEQVQFIKEQGGRYVQGYYFYKPMPAEEFEKLL